MKSHNDQTTPPTTVRRGVVKRFSSLHGYGFIGDSSVDGDVMVHQSQIQMHGFRQLRPGQEVTYVLNRGERGAFATQVTPMSERQSA